LTDRTLRLICAADLHIGRRPILAFGNSDGDLAMLRYCRTGPGPRLALLIHHDDAEREFAYDREFRDNLDYARQEIFSPVMLACPLLTVMLTSKIEYAVEAGIVCRYMNSGLSYDLACNRAVDLAIVVDLDDGCSRRFGKHRMHAVIHRPEMVGFTALDERSVDVEQDQPSHDRSTSGQGVCWASIARVGYHCSRTAPTR
jgi:hypothetical protein